MLPVTPRFPEPGLLSVFSHKILDENGADLWYVCGRCIRRLMMQFPVVHRQVTQCKCCLLSLFNQIDPYINLNSSVHLPHHHLKKGNRFGHTLFLGLVNELKLKMFPPTLQIHTSLVLRRRRQQFVPLRLRQAA